MVQWMRCVLIVGMACGGTRAGFAQVTCCRPGGLCAVVAKPDEKWGEVPCAFVELKPGMEVTEKELIAHCRARLAGFATPKMVVFADLPKTSTGKIQKFELRAVAKLL